MTLEDLLRQKKSAIIKKWTKAVLGTYPSDTQRFFKKQKDPFANPVGTTLSREIESLFEAFLKGIDAERLFPILDRMLRIRAIQDFTPSQAVGFIFRLKGIIRSEIGEAVPEKGLAEELVALDSSIDDLAMMGFDVYIKCREKLYEISANQAKNQVGRLLQKAGLICELKEEEAFSGGENPHQ